MGEYSEYSPIRITHQVYGTHCTFVKENPHMKRTTQTFTAQDIHAMTLREEVSEALAAPNPEAALRGLRLVAESCLTGEEFAWFMRSLPLTTLRLFIRPEPVLS